MFFSSKINAIIPQDVLNTEDTKMAETMKDYEDMLEESYSLMGDGVQARREYIQKNAQSANLSL